ncbi:MAG: DUF4089 domain-containing protein [Burkholderiales bacterium]
MNDDQIQQYIRVCALSLGLPTDAPRVLRVAGHFKRIDAMAHALDQVDCPVDLEMPEIYCPKRVSE